MTESNGRSRQAERIVRLEGMEDFRRYCCEFASRALHSLEITSHDLDGALFDQQHFLDAVKNLCLRNHLNRLRILLQDNTQVQRQGHRLVGLSRRLPSSIEIRKPHSDYTDQENFLIVDRTAFIRWRVSSRYQGTASHRDLLQSRRLSDLFNEIWQRSQPDSDLRRLHL
ncbi:MAG: acyltransferase [Gammaproteobacteria bacterium]|nr:acyltransferase [Gammaproteobacteria bacterium]MCP5416446.1 acyltransferase [Chromatiaceae bacterium]